MSAKRPPPRTKPAQPRIPPSDGSRSQRLKTLLGLVADDLLWYRDAGAAAREEYRKEIDQFDAGYIASLMTMLFAESTFDRWRHATTHAFKHFKRPARRP